MSKLFSFLCECLGVIGRFFGWNYQKASVYICIHLWPLLCVAASLVMTGVAISTGNITWIAACVIYAMLNIFGYWAVIRHYYPGTINEIFQLCWEELIVIAEHWHTSYAVVNLVIYLVLFAAIMTFDVLLIILML